MNGYEEEEEKKKKSTHGGSGRGQGDKTKATKSVADVSKNPRLQSFFALVSKRPRDDDKGSSDRN